MARPREFDTEKAITGAMTIFWRQGFKATSLPELLAAMGLSRGSFYKAFDDKESVYLQALDHYDATVVTQALLTLEDCTSALAADCLARLFAPSGMADRGCFICNAMVELAPDNPEVAAKTQAMADRLRGGIGRVLETRGIGDSAAARREISDLVLHLYFGHQALGKSGPRQSNWQDRLHRLVSKPQTGR